MEDKIKLKVLLKFLMPLNKLRPDEVIIKIFNLLHISQCQFIDFTSHSLKIDTDFALFTLYFRVDEEGMFEYQDLRMTPKKTNSQSLGWFTEIKVNEGFLNLNDVQNRYEYLVSKLVD